MREVHITQTQFDELCCCGKLHFVNHDVYSINWQTYYKKVAVSIPVSRINDKESYEVIRLVVE